MANLTSGVISGALTRSEFGESDTDNYFENSRNNIVARTVNLRVNTQQVDGSTLIWGNTTYGIWGSYYWGSAFSTPIVRVREQFMWTDYEEDFVAGSAIDGGNSTVSGIGTGSVVFTLGSSFVVPDLTTGSYEPTILASSGSIVLI